MANALKKGVIILAVLFVLFFLLNDPDGLADVTTRLWGGVEWLFGTVSALFASMLDFVRAVG